MRKAAFSGTALQARTRSPCARLRAPTSSVTTEPEANLIAPVAPVEDHVPVLPERSMADPFCIVTG